jgi:hypothetical protein
MAASVMRSIAVRAAKKTYPTGNPAFAVMQAFPSAVSESRRRCAAAFAILSQRADGRAFSDFR